VGASTIGAYWSFVAMAASRTRTIKRRSFVRRALAVSSVVAVLAAETRYAYRDSYATIPTKV